MSPDKGQALMLLLRGKGPSKDAPAAKESDSADYDGDMKAALADLADAMGVKLRDPEKAVEAMKTLHDLCDRASGEGE